MGDPLQTKANIKLVRLAVLQAIALTFIFCAAVVACGLSARAE